MKNYVFISDQISQKKDDSCELTLSPAGPLGPGDPSSPWGERHAAIEMSDLHVENILAI